MRVCVCVCFYHESSHSLFLNPLILLLLLSLGVGMVRGHGFGQLLDLGGDGAMIFLEVLGMLQDAVEIFLHQSKKNYGKCSPDS